MKARLSVPVAVLSSVIALFAAGCGGSGSSTGSDPASLAPPDALLFIEGTVQPNGQMAEDIDQIAGTVAGVDNLGNLIVSELESSAEDNGEPFDYATEVKPWLGEKAGIYFRSFDGDNLTDFSLAVQTTDADAAKEFVDKRAGESNDEPKKGSYEGNTFYSEDGEGPTVGVVGDFFVIAESSSSFKDAVDASEGDSLADQSAFDEAISNASEGSLADVYVDVGALIEQGEGEVDDQVLQALKSAGINPREATAVASIVPGSDQVEVDISSDTGGKEAPTGNASNLLGSLPGDSFAAFAVSDFGKQLEEAIEELDKQGIPGQVPPGKLQSGIEELGFDLEKVAGSLENAGVFASGSSEGNIGGALVLTTGDSREVATAVSVIGALVRQSGTPGVTALSGRASGFSIRDPEKLGPQPLVVATKGDRVAIGYGVRQTLRGLSAGGGSTLADTPNYEDAVASLGDTPISGFVDGAAALQLADSFVPSSETGFEAAKPYLKAIRFLAIGSGTEGDRATAKLIAGLKK
jgi:hypothetical protein